MRLWGRWGVGLILLSLRGTTQRVPNSSQPSTLLPPTLLPPLSTCHSLRVTGQVNDGSAVLDPFCGTAGVLLAAVAVGADSRSSLGVDIDPAVLLGE